MTCRAVKDVPCLQVQAGCMLVMTQSTHRYAAFTPPANQHFDELESWAITTFFRARGATTQVQSDDARGMQSNFSAVSYTRKPATVNPNFASGEWVNRWCGRCWQWLACSIPGGWALNRAGCLTLPVCVCVCVYACVCMCVGVTYWWWLHADDGFLIGIN